MLELYFIIYRVPKMMTRLARERGRSALGWSLLGIATWTAAEVVVFFVFGIAYGIGELTLGWPEPIPAGVKLVSYILALASALLSVTMVSRILTRTTMQESFTVPPPPPDFHSESDRAT
jgi:Kef-type K+ transport system membrane component KefB